MKHNFNIHNTLYNEESLDKWNQYKTYIFNEKNTENGQIILQCYTEKSMYKINMDNLNNVTEFIFATKNYLLFIEK
jgi:hypothetical protein